MIWLICIVAEPLYSLVVKKMWRRGMVPSRARRAAGASPDPQKARFPGSCMLGSVPARKLRGALLRTGNTKPSALP
ncbi:hypothetical protein [Thiohalocapsa halophila]|uniref:hypothetical protein n=1 Tax=Thiohalocapsa halophila TaxID=69359 RepID=UPI001903C9A9|nr:hypothetical protein [Thiohalocapsa halophila]